jgi:hypothetical protein
LKALLLTALAVLLLLGAYWLFRNPAATLPASQITEAPKSAPAGIPPTVAEPPPQDLPATTAAHRAALQDRVQELRQRRTDLSKKLESIDQRLAEKGNAAGPTHLEEAKAALQETLQKEELEEKYLQETIDNPPTSAAAP